MSKTQFNSVARTQNRRNGKLGLAGKMSKSAMGRSIVLAVAGVASSLCGLDRTASASDISLQNGNSIVQINTGSETTNPAGAYSWTLNNGANNSAQNWFYYSVSNQTPVAVNTLGGTPTVSTFSSQGTGKPINDATLMYNDTTDNLKTTLTYLLTGGAVGSHTSNLSQQVQLTNTGKTALSLKFFVYADFNLAGLPGGQSLTTSGQNTATQTDSFGDKASSVVSGRATYVAAGSNGSLMTNVLDASNPTLAGQPASVSNTNASWAFEYDVTIGAGQTYALGDQTQLNITGSVPEPASGMAMLAAAGIFLTRPRRRDEDADPKNTVVAEA